MVKADLARDYYGDLELPPSVDAQEIKKQYKKLGMTGACVAFAFITELTLFTGDEQRSNITRTEILGMKANSMPSSKPFSQPMMFS